MKTVYEAANALEAHMLVDLLKQQGITAHVRGEALQGAVGEMPASGLVRLEVAEQDHAAARAVIDAWARTQVEPTPPAPTPARTRRFSAAWGLVLGLALGLAGSYLAVRVPASQDGVDYNGDGRLDETWTYAPSGRLLKVEIDRNLDGKVDYVARYDARGRIESAELDDDFDGVFETRQWLKNGNVEWALTDTDGDGYPDQRTNYTHGVAESVEFIDPASGKPFRVEHFVLGMLKYADVDTDLDGTLDTRLRYNKRAEVEAREPLTR